jgi:hypothetical protein
VRRRYVRIRLVTGRTYVMTSRQGLARALWSYGEDGLWTRALDLPLERMLDVGQLAGDLYCAKTSEWLGRRVNAGLCLALAGIQTLEGEPRPPRLLRRRPDRQLPAELINTDPMCVDPELGEVDRLLHARLDIAGGFDSPHPLRGFR